MNGNQDQMNFTEENVIPEGLVVGVDAEPQVQAQAPIVSGGQFLVRSVTGNVLHFSLDQDMTVEQLKQKIFEAQGLAVDQQRLIFNAKQLEDQMTLGQCGVGNDATIHLVLRVRGGF